VFNLNLKQFANFNSPHVRRRLDKLTYHYLRFQGMNIRRNARRRLQSGKEGAPVSKGNRGLRQIRYAFDRSEHSVVVGPLLFKWQPWSNFTVPELLEYGGVARLKRQYSDYADRGILHPGFYRERSYMRNAARDELKPQRQRQVWRAAERRTYK